MRSVDLWEAMRGEKLVGLKVIGDVIWGLVNFTSLKNLMYYLGNDWGISPESLRVSGWGRCRGGKEEGAAGTVGPGHCHP